MVNVGLVWGCPENSVFFPCFSLLHGCKQGWEMDDHIDGEDGDEACLRTAVVFRGHQIWAQES